MKQYYGAHEKIMLHVDTVRKRGPNIMWDFEAYLASKASAQIPAANGADADVPVCAWVHNVSVLGLSRNERSMSTVT